jgi:hypothetical protein
MSSVKKFNTWICEFFNPYSQNPLTRGQYIYELLGYYVYPMLKSAGYELSINRGELKDRLATWLYIIHRRYKKEVSPVIVMPMVTHKGRMRYLEGFLGVFSDNYWLRVHGAMESSDEFFICERAADFFWCNLTYFLYRFLNVATSPAVAAVDQLERQLEDEEREYLIAEGLYVEEKKRRPHEDELYYQEAGFFRGDRRYE